MSEPLISIVVPVYNGEPFIGACVESLLAIDYPQEKFEIIVVDNNSSDRTREIVSQYSVLLLSEGVQGSSSARNTGIEAARGKIVAFTDSNCVVESSWASEIEKTFQDTHIDAVMGFADGINDNMFAEIVQKGWVDFWYKNDASGYSPKRIGVDARNCAVRKEVFQHVGYFSPENLYCSDFELSIRLNRGGYRIVFNPNMKVWHKNPTSFDVSLEKSRNQLQSVLQMMRNLPKGVKEEHVPFPSSAFHGIGGRDIRGVKLKAVLMLMRSLRFWVLSGFRVCLALRIRHRMTFKLYKVFFGLSYDIALLRAKRQANVV